MNGIVAIGGVDGMRESDPSIERVLFGWRFWDLVGVTREG